MASLKNTRLIFAPFKAAYGSGLSAIKHTQAQPKSDEVSDSLLPDATLIIRCRLIGRGVMV